MKEHANNTHQRTFMDNHRLEWNNQGTGLGTYSNGLEETEVLEVKHIEDAQPFDQIVKEYLTAFLITATKQNNGKTTPISERANSLTSSLDSSTGEGVVRILRTSDAQMFAGYDVFPSLADDSVRNSLDRGAVAAANVLRHPKGIVIISGSGTSGRLAFMVATMLNKTVRACTGSNSSSSSSASPESKTTAATTTATATGGPFYYCNSGGDSALLLPSELAEDNTIKGVSDLQEVIQQANATGAPVMVIGVTCGMSAPYVAGQLDYVLHHIAHDVQTVADFTACLIGFNPTSMARNIPIEMWSERPPHQPHTFRDIAYALEAGVTQEKTQKGLAPRHIVINPVVGPESLCGSTRMKGGSATKICLETMLSMALQQVFGKAMQTSGDKDTANQEQDTQEQDTQKQDTQKQDTQKQDTQKKQDNQEQHRPRPHGSTTVIASFYNAFVASYSQTSTLGRAVEIVGESLKSKGRIYYVGCGVAAKVGFIDASEMRPTFGAPASETRAFALHGWQSLGNVDGDLTNMGALYRIHFQNFREDLMGGQGAIALSSADVVVALHCPNEHGQDSAAVDQLACEAAAASGCRTIRLGISSASSATAASGATFTVSVNVATDFPLLLPGYDAFGAFALKIALNALSTGGQALAGRVLSNRMINVTPSNHKLFLRCTGLIALLGEGGVSEEKATRCLIRSIYKIDDPVKVNDLLALPVSDYIKAAGAAGSIQKSNQLLPIAILLASDGADCNTVEKAKKLLSKFGTVREALSSL